MAVSINDVRETVLAICNKNNYGYISPDDFNLYAKQAQLDILDEYMPKYNQMMNAQKQHASGQDLTDLAEQAAQNLEVFVTVDILSFVSSSAFFSIFNLPSDYYHILNLNYGTTSLVELEKVNNLEFHRLINSNLTAPTEQDPIYTQGDDTIGVNPVTIVSDVSAYYIRRPLDPVWGYVTLTNGEPVYNPSSSTDFEVAADEESQLVSKILEKAGLSIRESEVYKTAQGNDNEPQ